MAMAVADAIARFATCGGETLREGEAGVSKGLAQVMHLHYLRPLTNPPFFPAGFRVFWSARSGGVFGDGMR
ncbi:hypothetical protein M2360_005285, partial [Rhizobium sp. SG_E_25_P2]|uniref:hypothetical protein n=1 Tax=Rhizobium sp. SG_E_25_P2 TaxID=2879942 RepID=UPI002475A559